MFSPNFVASLSFVGPVFVSTLTTPAFNFISTFASFGFVISFIGSLSLVQAVIAAIVAAIEIILNTNVFIIIKI